MINFCLNEGVSIFIMQSQINLENFMKIKQTTHKTNQEILEILKISKLDFTDSDWNIISRYS